MARNLLILLLCLTCTSFAALKRPLITLTLRLQRCEMTTLIKDIQRGKLTRDHIDLMDKQHVTKHIYTSQGRPIDLSNIPFMEFYKEKKSHRTGDDLNRLVCSSSPYKQEAVDDEWYEEQFPGS